MRKRRKILFALISLSGVFLSLVIILLIIVPTVINLDTIKKQIRSQYAQNIGGEIEYQHIDLAVFPRPHVVISKIILTMPANISGTVDSLKIYPKILPLFTGSLQVGVIDSRSPEINIRFAVSPKKESRSQAPFSFETLGERLNSAVGFLPAIKFPTMVAQIRSGRVHFFEGKERILGLQNINGKVKHSNGRFEFDLQCQSNFWESIAVQGQYEPQGFKMKGRVKINQFRPHAVVQYFFPQSELKMTNARANLTLDLETNGPHHLQASARGTIPYVYWRYGNKDLKFSDTDFEGAFQLEDNNVTLSLQQLNLKNPRLNLSGRLDIDPKLPLIKCNLMGRQIDVETVQRAALALSENSAAVTDIFEILRGGEFQQITLAGQGPDWAHMADIENYVLQGSLDGGKIFIPEGQLNLEDVKGDARISNGILEGENIEARMGNSFARKGRLAIALNEDIAPFHIECLIQADLSQLPPVLKRLVENDNLQKELALFEKFEGSAVGMLVIGEDTENFNVRVMASDIQLNARYQRIPFPMRIIGGNLNLDGTRIALTNFNAAIGKSSLSRLSSKFGWAKTPFLELSSKSANIDLTQLYTCLATNQTFEADLQKIKALSGTVSLQNVNLKGPLLKPHQWRLKSTGDIQNLSLSSSLLPGNLNVAKGHFTCEGEQLKVQNLNALVGKSSFSDLTALLRWGKVMTLSAKTQQTVVFLDEVFPWLQSHAALKPYLKPIEPLSGTLAFQSLAFNGPLAGKMDHKLSLEAAIQKWDIHSPGFPTPIELAGGDLFWRGTRIDLKETDARFGESAVTRLALGKQWGKASLFELKADSADIRIADLYPWLISFDTLEQMLKGFAATQGKIALSSIYFKKGAGSSSAWQFQLAGDLQDLALESDYFKAPIQINTANFSATDTPGAENIQGHIDLNATQMSWEDSQMLLQGQAAFSADALRLDMQLTADRLNQSQIDQILELEKPLEPGSTLELRGSLGVESDNFTYEGYTWQPMHADISFNETDTRIVIKKAALCGIRFPGILKISADDVEFYFNPVAENQNLEPSLACLSAKKNLADGSFNLKGELMSKAKPNAFPKSLTGNLGFTANQGRIYRFGMLAKIFALLNVTEIYRGEVPDLMGKGFAYNSITANGVFQDGKLIIKDTSIDSPSMGIAIEGDIDLIKKKVNLVVLVAPFKTVDRIVKYIPLVGNILGGNLISIPFRAIGDLADPDVIPLSPTAVGSGLLGILERTLKLPITIIQPVLPGSKDKEVQEKNQKILP